MTITTCLDWVEPVAVWWAETSDQDDHFFLQSAKETPYSGRYSYLALAAKNQHDKISWAQLDEMVRGTDKNDICEAWWVLLGYEDQISACQFNVVYVWDHHKKTITRHAKIDRPIPDVLAPSPEPLAPLSTSFTSNMSKTDYLDHVQSALNEIHAGTFYQVNLTRKFWTPIPKACPDFHRRCFLRLVQESPAPYSAYIQCGEQTVISSSPVSKDAKQDNDEQGAETLKNSIKDQSENLMIVDLMRHDLSKFCVPGTVKVPTLFDVTSHATVHHMSSLIEGQHDTRHSVVSAIHAAFPPGSMTGTPKSKAIDYAHRYETLPRGIYSGAIGYILPDKAELSVVIRTIVCTEDRLEFQVGGAIVAQSTPESEWRETLTKAAGMCRALGVDPFDVLSF